MAYLRVFFCVCVRCKKSFKVIVSVNSLIRSSAMSCIWWLRPRGLFSFRNKSRQRNKTIVYLYIIPRNEKKIGQLSKTLLVIFFLSNNTSWKSRWELVLDYHYRIHIGFCHIGDRHCTLVLLSLPTSEKRYVFSIVSSFRLLFTTWKFIVFVESLKNYL